MNDLSRALSAITRRPLAHLPTPLEELPRLTAALRGPRLLVKRDDCTGLGLGGNKTRKLEFLLADALQHGADTVITRSEEHTSELQSLMRISYAVFCLKKKTTK